MADPNEQIADLIKHWKNSEKDLIKAIETIITAAREEEKKCHEDKESKVTPLNVAYRVPLEGFTYPVPLSALAKKREFLEVYKTLQVNGFEGFNSDLETLAQNMKEHAYFKTEQKWNALLISHEYQVTTIIAQLPSGDAMPTLVIKSAQVLYQAIQQSKSINIKERQDEKIDTIGFKFATEPSYSDVTLYVSKAYKTHSDFVLGFLKVKIEAITKNKLKSTEAPYIPAFIADIFGIVHHPYHPVRDPGRITAFAELLQQFRELDHQHYFATEAEKINFLARLAPQPIATKAAEEKTDPSVQALLQRGTPVMGAASVKLSISGDKLVVVASPAAVPAPVPAPS